MKQDFTPAARWYRKAADQGDANAQYNLGLSYANGRGAKQDFGEAARLYRKAADQGYANAHFNLSAKYANGQGVKQDFGKAERWLRKAAYQGNENAKKAMLVVKEKLRKHRPAASASQSSSSRTCANCGIAETAGGASLKPCSRCKAVVYCGKECQAQHWKKAGGHKAVCE